MKKPLEKPVRYLKGIGPKRARLFNSLGIESIEDLLYYFPYRYEDRTNFLLIKDLSEGSLSTLKAKVFSVRERVSLRRRNFKIIEAVVGDNSGKILCVWFNQPYLKNYFKPGEEVILYGKAQHYAGKMQINSPEFELIDSRDSDSLNIGRIVPVYSLPKGMTQRVFRSTVREALDGSLPKLKDFLPFDIRSRSAQINLAKALANIHFPDTLEGQKQAYERLSFDEFFIFQLPLALRKANKSGKPGIAHKTDGKLTDGFICSLPFEFTASQKRVIAEIKTDMSRPVPMQRLLQGDVGSGKTVVATLAAMIAAQGGYQTAFMVPTEILANQHYEKISSQLTAYSSKVKQVRIGLLTSSLSKEEKDKIYQEIESGKTDLIIGTHALLEGKIQFKNLGLVVIDEQHKFGVGQRALLPRKGFNPDVLIMTATPIPRTLAITLYGDLDISVINELPPGRKPVKTICFDTENVGEAYGLAKEQLGLGYQAYIIYPVIEESYALDIAGAKKRYEELKKYEFKDFRIGLIYGRLKQPEQDELMRKFRDKQLDILVATTILEVGIDIPNATCMIIEHAERFGLAGLHQLRGRVGRGSADSFCLLLADAETEEARRRLKAMERFSDGFRIAEEDLKIRGPGEFFGRRQHGLTELKIGNPLSQMQLLKRAREEALRMVESDPGLRQEGNLPLREKLLQRFPEYERLMVVG